MRKYYTGYTDAGSNPARSGTDDDDDDNPRGRLFDHLAAIPQPVADAEAELNSYLSSPLVKYAKLKFDEDRGYSVRMLPEQAGIPADPLEYWKVSGSERCGAAAQCPDAVNPNGLVICRRSTRASIPCCKDGP